MVTEARNLNPPITSEPCYGRSDLFILLLLILVIVRICPFSYRNNDRNKTIITEGQSLEPQSFGNPSICTDIFVLLIIAGTLLFFILSEDQEKI